jgi:HSP20 family protein
MLMRFDPFRELDRLAQTAGAAFESRWSPMPMDGYRHGDRFVMHFDLPGVDPASIDLTVEKNVLTVSAERRWQLDDGIEVVVSERPQGSFSRQLFLGEGLDPEHVEATYDSGVLTVTVPVAEQAKPRKIAVQDGAGGATAIAAESHEAA